MLANQTSDQARPAVVSDLSLESRPATSFPLLGEAQFSSPPALPSVLLRLEWLLSEFVADLQGITNLIRGDIGLTAQLLRLAARETEGSPDTVVAISDLVVNVGLEKLRALVARTNPLPDDLSGDPGVKACERFWMHCRLTASVAEELAGRSPGIRSEDAYLAGLLCHLGDLPSLLGQVAPGSDATDTHELGYRMASTWGFPHILAEVIGGDRKAGFARESRALLDIVTAADIWACRLEDLAKREAKKPQPRIHLVE